jgi:hypothetical protein
MVLQMRIQRDVERLHTIPASLDRAAAVSHATFAIRAATAQAFPLWRSRVAYACSSYL